jgi:hypothetical protein
MTVYSYQQLSGVNEEKKARPRSGEWKFEPVTLRTYALIAITTRDISVTGNDDDVDDYQNDDARE